MERDEHIEELIQQIADQGSLYDYAAVDALKCLAESWSEIRAEGMSLLAFQTAARQDILATIETLKDYLYIMQAAGLAA